MWDKAIKSALFTARKMAEGGSIRDVMFDPTPMNRKSPNQRVREGHQEFEQGYGHTGYESLGRTPILNRRGQRLEMQRAADGGAQRTAAFPEKPEGYEFYGPEEGPGTAPVQQEVPNTEGMLSYDPAQEPPRKGPPAIMEPDLTQAQTGEMPEGISPETHTINEIGAIVDKRTGEPVQFTRRPNVLPLTKTPQGDIEFAMPKALDILGNMGGGWSAPVSAGEVVLGAGARLARRTQRPRQARNVANDLVAVHGDDEAAIANWLDTQKGNGADVGFLEDVIGHLPKDLQERVINYGASLSDKLKGQAALSPAATENNIQSVARNLVEQYGNDEAAIVRWFDTAEGNGVDSLLLNKIFDSLPPELRRRVKIHDAYSHEKPRPKPSDEELARLKAKDDERIAQLGETPTEQEFKQIPYEPPTEVPRRDYGSLDELESALRGSPHRVPSDRPQVELQPQTPPYNGELIGIGPIFNTSMQAAEVGRMTDNQLSHIGELLHSRSDSFLRHLGQNRPETLRAVLREIATRGADGRYSQLIDKLMRQLLQRAMRERIIPVGNEGTPVVTGPRGQVIGTAHPNQPIAEGNNLSLGEFFGSHDKRDIGRLSGRQLENLADQLNDHEAISSGLYSNLENYHPETLRALRGAIRDYRDATVGGEPSRNQQIGDQLRRMIEGQRAAAARTPRPQPPDPGPFGRVSRDIDTFLQRTIGRFINNSLDSLSNQMFAGNDVKQIEVMTLGRGLSFDGYLRTPDGKSVGRIERTIYPDEKIAYHGYFSAHPDVRSTGIPAELLRSQIYFYKRIGIKQVKLSAGLESGPLAWAKYGWVPNQRGWDSIRDSIKFEVDRDLLHITNPDTKSAFLKILNSDNPRDMWKIADFRGTDKDGRVIGAYALLGHDYIPPPGVPHGRDVGKKGWSGILQLDDPVVMRRFDDYAKRKPRAKPERPRS